MTHAELTGLCEHRLDAVEAAISMVRLDVEALKSNVATLTESLRTGRTEEAS